MFKKPPRAIAERDFPTVDRASRHATDAAMAFVYGEDIDVETRRGRELVYRALHLATERWGRQQCQDETPQPAAETEA